MKLASAFLGFLISASSAHAFSFDYAGKDSNEARLSYSHHVEINTMTTPGDDEAYAAIMKQTEHLFGPMDYGPEKAVPRGNYRVTNIGVRRSGLMTFEASYDISMTVAIESHIQDTYMVVLPVNPDLIYQAGMKNGKNHCTDAHYQSEDDFWYFWSPDRPGCPLKEGRDYELVEAKVKPLSNTDRTYAEFDRMADKDGLVHVDMFYGMDKPNKHSWNPERSSDENAANYRYVARKLRALGFEGRKLSPKEIREVALEIDSDSLPTVEVFTKTYPKVRGRNIKKIVVTMFFGATGVEEPSSAFHYFYKQSIENSAMMIYAGHSGLGGHLDLESIEGLRSFQLKLNKSRYQLFYFNSCTSYTYYNTMYFSKKKTSSDARGTKNLDIITNGLATYFSSIDESNLELVRGVDTWAVGGQPPSFQEMASKMDSGNLLGVNGDEDNPTQVPVAN